MQVLPFDTEIFEYTSDLNKDSDVSGAVLQSYPVVIATVNGSGPIPAPFTKHSASARRKLNNDPLDIGGVTGTVPRVANPRTMLITFFFIDRLSLSYNRFWDRDSFSLETP